LGGLLISYDDLKDRSRFVSYQALDGCAMFAQNGLDSRSRYVSDAQQTTLGGDPRMTARSTMSLSFVTMMKSCCFA
jgi:hypothetical protein